MPPKTAMRRSSGIVPSAGRIGANAAVPVAGPTSMMSQREWPLGFRKCRTEDRIRRFDENRADVNAAIGGDPGAAAQQLAGIELGHHLPRHPLVIVITALARGFGANS